MNNSLAGIISVTEIIVRLVPFTFKIHGEDCRDLIARDKGKLMSDLNLRDKNVIDQNILHILLEY